MEIIECENIVLMYFEDHFKNYEHSNNKELKINNSKYRIKPDDIFYFKDSNEIILIEYENTKRPIESISKYWWLLERTNWLNEEIKIQLLILGLYNKLNEIRNESIQILGSELKYKYSKDFDFFYIPWKNVSELEIIKKLDKMTMKFNKL